MVTYQKAQEEIKFLSNYIKLIDNYDIETLEDLVIYNYAIHNSISKVISVIKDRSFSQDIIVEEGTISQAMITQTILSAPKNDLHKIIRSEYKKKTRPQRRRSKKTDF